MVHVISSQDMYSCSRQWTSREQDFVKHTRKILLHIVAKKLEKPPMFVVRDGFNLFLATNYMLCISSFVDLIFLVTVFTFVSLPLSFSYTAAY